MPAIQLLVLGLVAGAMSGLIGNGGGILVIPALVYVFGFTQAKAQGTTLALMVLPIGLLAALTYWRAGSVDIKAAVLMAAGFFIGGWLGARYAVHLPAAALSKLFAVSLIVIGLYILLSPARQL